MVIAWLLHPFRPIEGETDNLARAKRWHKWCLRNLAEIQTCADWILWCELLDDSDPEERARGLAYDNEMVRRLDWVILAGGRMSSGMQSDLDVALQHRKFVLDLRDFGPEPPTDPQAIETARDRVRTLLKSWQWKAQRPSTDWADRGF